MQLRGFALVATISVMALLVMVALAMLSLSTIESRGSRQSSYIEEAQANARLALMVAIAQLQEHAGPDQRVTARADITDPNWEEVLPSSSLTNPHYTYVWDVSGAEHNLAQTSIALTNETLNRPGSDPAHDFTKIPSVLVSGNESYSLTDAEGNRLTSYPDGYTTADSSTEGQINIVPSSYFFDTNTQHSISVPVVDVGNTGAYAYWIGDESIKSRANIGNQHENSSPAANLLAQRSPLNPLVDGMDTTNESLTDSKKTHTVKSLEVLYPEIPRGWSYSPDYTVSSTSLLTNTRNGGFKQDFTYALFNDETAAGIPAELKDNNILLDPLISIWSGKEIPWGWKGTVQTLSAGLAPAVKYLRDYAKINTPPLQPVSIGQHGIAPVMSQFQGSIHCAYKVDGAKFKVYYSVFPSVTFWNPYNVPITLDKDITVVMQRRAAHRHGGMNAFKASYNLIGTPGYSSGNIFHGSHASSGWLYSLKIDKESATVIQSGETLIFSPKELTIEDTAVTTRHQQRYQATIEVGPGWRPGKGHLFAIDGIEHDASLINAGSDHLPRAQISLLGSGYENITIEARYQDPDLGSKLFSRWSRLGSTMSSGDSPTFDPPLVTDAQQDAAGNFPSFLHKYALRMGEEYLPLPETEIKNGQETLLFPYAAHFNPRAVYHAAFADSAHSDLRFVPDGVGVSSTLMGSLYDEQSARHIYSVPTIDTDDLRSYIGSGYLGASEKMILAELPISLPESYPNSISGGITSLTQLNHSNLTSGMFEVFHSYYDILLSTSNYPAFPIGNSLGDIRLNLKGHSIDKSNLTTVGSVAKVDNQGWASRSQSPHYDVSLLLNERLYDHYFFSTIPQTGDYEATEPLINARMTPTTDTIADLRSISSAEKLTLKGGFNINSTSVKAWEMLLSSSMGTEREGVDSSSDTATFAGKRPSAGSVNIRSIDSTQAAEGTQSLSLTPGEITLLAEAIVRQVKRRGPFPNLAAFVNRTNTLSSLLRNDANSYSEDEFQDVRFTGALQAAIDSIELQEQLMQGKAIDPDDYLNNIYIYPGREAVRKSANSHLPGSLKQSDILRQIDPVMTNRGDTFIIRTVGIAKDSEGNIAAKAACEAIVQRTVNYMDSSQKTDVVPLEWDEEGTETSPLNPINQKYGRRFTMKSFRWLTQAEVNSIRLRP